MCFLNGCLWLAMMHCMIESEIKVRHTSLCSHLWLLFSASYCFSWYASFLFTCGKRQNSKSCHIIWKNSNSCVICLQFNAIYFMAVLFCFSTATDWQPHSRHYHRHLVSLNISCASDFLPHANPIFLKIKWLPLAEKQNVRNSKLRLEIKAFQCTTLF